MVEKLFMFYTSKPSMYVPHKDMYLITKFYSNKIKIACPF
jgi:hypothetical protein